MSPTPIYDALTSEYIAGLGPTPAGRHRWVDAPTEPIPTTPMSEEDAHEPTRRRRR